MQRLSNLISRKIAAYRAERARLAALNTQLEGLTDPGLLDRILAPTVAAPPVPAPKPVFNPQPRPVRSIDGILRVAV
jgi:hypothetical protein